jgi:nicotinate-nucleotide pyrophosphorylase (carboxylating)
MLDNFQTCTDQRSIDVIDGHFETEASGGINLENIQQYAETGC